jgi:2-methylcitrate dehydratase PrpD
VEYVVDPDVPASRHFKGSVIVELSDGRRFERVEPINRGNVDNPMRREDVVEKFRDHARLAVPPDRIPQIETLVDRLDSAPSIQPLIDACLRPA